MGETVVLAAPGGTYELSIAGVKRGNEANFAVKKQIHLILSPMLGMSIC
jgi:hypothetical protein